MGLAGTAVVSKGCGRGKGAYTVPWRVRMESDPVKLGTMRLMGTFGVPSYISLGDQYMKKIRASSQLSSELAVPGSLGMRAVPFRPTAARCHRGRAPGAILTGFPCFACVLQHDYCGGGV